MIVRCTGAERDLRKLADGAAEKSLQLREDGKLDDK
jgi:hypothetical protein